MSNTSSRGDCALWRYKLRPVTIARESSLTPSHVCGRQPMSKSSGAALPHLRWHEGTTNCALDDRHRAALRLLPFRPVRERTGGPVPRSGGLNQRCEAHPLLLREMARWRRSFRTSTRDCLSLLSAFCARRRGVKLLGFGQPLGVWHERGIEGGSAVQTWESTATNRRRGYCLVASRRLLELKRGPSRPRADKMEQHVIDTRHSGV